MYIDDSPGTTITNCSFTNNSAGDQGGAIFNDYTSAANYITIKNTTITGNSATSEGGGIYNVAQLKVEGEVVIDGNTKGSGVTSNVYISDYTDSGRHYYIDINTAGLSCGSRIGVTKTFNYSGSGSSRYTQIASGTATNCINALKYQYFFDDTNAYGIYTSNSSPYSTTKLYFSGLCNSWMENANASGCTISSGYVTQVNTAAGLAYLAKDVASGKDYSGKTVVLTADLNLAGHNWYPIGNACSGFNGTFNGQGHSITGLSTTLLLDNVGLFGTVGSGGTVKNVVVASSSISASSAVNLGGIAGEVDGGSVYNCISAATLSGGTNRGALVGKLTLGSVFNSFAISNDAACGSGTVTNCYVRKVSGGTASNMGTATNVGASGNTTGTFTETVTPYLYKHADNKVGSTALLTLLNAWVDAQSTPSDLARWSRTMASPINSDYPLLMMPGAKCVGTKSGNTNVLNYGSSFNTMLGTHNASGDNIFLYASETGVNTGNGSANVYIAEDVALLHTSTIANAHVGITLNPTNGSQGVHWHMFSPALSDAPLGISYPANGSYTPAYGPLPTEMQPTFTGTGYFPQTDYSGNDYYAKWDFYAYYEQQYHWINFKRNSDNHWHEDAGHENIEYTNENPLRRGQGYLVATDDACLLEAAGTLNQGGFGIPVTKAAAYRTGYNLLGNPYQSYLDFDAFAAYNSGGHDNRTLWSDNSVSSASYVILDKDGYHSYAYNSSTNTFGAKRYLHPHQGFMIIVGGNGSNAYFDNSMRTTTSTNAAFRDGEHIDYPLVNLIATEADGNRDITTIELGRPDRGGAFKQHDLHLGKGCIYTRYEDQDYAIAFTQPGISEVGVRFETDEDATYTLTWDMENGDFHYLHLIDNITGSDIDCLQEMEYRFTSSTDDYKSRFKLVFDYTGIEEPEGDGPSTGSGPFAFVMGNELVVNCGPSTGSGAALLQMFDVTGRLVMQRTVSGTQSTVSLPEASEGVYVLRLTDKNGVKVQKMVIR